MNALTVLAALLQKVPLTVQRVVHAAILVAVGVLVAKSLWPGLVPFGVPGQVRDAILALAAGSPVLALGNATPDPVITEADDAATQLALAVSNGSRPDEVAAVEQVVGGVVAPVSPPPA